MSVEFGPHMERLLAVAAAPSGHRLLIGGYRDVPGEATGSTLHVLKLPEMEAIGARKLPTAVTALACLDDELALVGTQSGALELTPIEGGEPVFTDAKAHSAAVTAIALDPLGKLVATVGEDGVLRVWKRDGKKLESVATRPFGARPLRAVAIDPRGDWIAAAGDAGVVHALRTEALTNGGQVRDMDMDNGVGALLFSGDGRIVAGCSDGSVRIAFLEGAPDAENRSKGAEHERAVRGLVLGAELFDEANRALPRRLYSVAEDGSLKAWDLESRRRPKTEDIGGEPRDMIWVAPPSNAPADARGGALVVASRTRRVSVSGLDQEGQLKGKRTLKSLVARLADDLKKGKTPVRLTALDELSPLPEDEARRLLDRVLLHDKAHEVRQKAATKIASSGRRRSRGALRQALNDNKPEVRKEALNSLTSLEKDNPFSAARAALSSKHPDMRITALARMPGLRDASPLVPSLVAQHLKDGDAKVRIAALDALYTLEGKQSVEPVRVAFARGTDDIRREALIRLCGAGLAASEGAELVELALDDDAQGVRDTAFVVAMASRPGLAAVLGQIEAFGKKLEKLKEDGGKVAAGGGSPSEAERQPLFASLTARHVDVAVQGAWALGVLADPRAIGALLQLSRDGSAAVRRSVIELAQHAILGGVPGAAQLRGRIEWLLNDTDKNVRAAAFDALAKLEESDGADGEMTVAELALRCVYDEIRLRALQILVKFGGQGPHASNAELAQKADGLLGDALDDEHAKVRDEAFRTLWAWHSASPQPALERAARSRHADLRRRMVGEANRLKDQKWADALLIELTGDADANVGLEAYRVLLEVEANKTRGEIHKAALFSPSPRVIAQACSQINASAFVDLRQRILDLIDDERLDVNRAAIRCFDRLRPSDEAAFQRAFDSIFYELRVTAIELCGNRRDPRCIVPSRALLALPESDSNRPSPELRQRIARALASVGHVSLIPFFVQLLQDVDPLVREFAARGLATAARPGGEQPLVDALAHADLPVRSWVAEGLARLGDPRSLPVLAGTLGHNHRPIRLGAIMGFVALGPEGTRGLLMGLDDADREIQDLVFAVIVARDLALAKKDLPPDLLLSALSSTHPEVRFAAARFLEARMAGSARDAAVELVGPTKPDKAADMEKWPDESGRTALQNVLVDSLASDDPGLRYAATQVLALRNKPLAYWREVALLRGPQPVGSLRIPHTNWSDEARQPRKMGWMRTLVQGLGAEGGDEGLRQLVFGVYAGLVRQAPAQGAADETHRIRRDSLTQLTTLAPNVGPDAVLPVVRRGLNDPHHLVRKSAVTALRELHDEGDRTPLMLMLQAQAADVGKAAVDELLEKAGNGDQQAREMAIGALDAPHHDVRLHALSKIGQLYEANSLEPLLVALGSRHSDVRLAVVDRLVGSADARVAEALGKAMESEHLDLQLKAANVLAARGDRRTLDVLAGMLRSDRANVVQQATNALIALGTSQDLEEAARKDTANAVATAIVARLEDDPDATAPKKALCDALGRLGSTAPKDMLLRYIEGEDANDRRIGFETAMAIARAGRKPRENEGIKRLSYDEPFALEVIGAASASIDAQLRVLCVAPLRDIDDSQADAVLAALVDDRDEGVRVQSVQALAHRAEHAPEGGPATETLAAVLRDGKRELVLPAAEGLAKKGRKEAFQSLVLVLKAGETPERQRAVLALGNLGDPRGLEELEPLAFPDEELEPEDKLLIPFSVEALGRMIPHLKGEEATRVRDAVENVAKQGAPMLRQRAITGLRFCGDERSRTLLQNLLSDRHEELPVRVHCAQELGKLGHEGSVDVLAEALTDEQYNLRQNALASLRKLLPEDETRISLLALQSPYNDVSAPAAQYLAREGDAETLVEQLATIEDDSVRERLRKGLIRRKLVPTSALTKLLEQGAPGPRGDAALMAAEADAKELGGAVAKAFARSVDEVEALRGKKDNRLFATTRACLMAAVKLGADVGPARKLKDHDELGAQAFAALFDRDELSEEELIAGLSSARFKERWLSARALSRKVPGKATQILSSLAAPSTAAVAPLAKVAVENEPDKVMGDAKLRGLALPTMLDSQHAPLVKTALESGSKPERLSAISALGKSTDPGEAVQTLESILGREGEPDEVRALAFKALRRAQRAVERAARWEEQS